MRLSISLIFILLCLICTSTAKKIKDDDFSEFDDFDQDEFVIETPSSTDSPPLSSNKPEARNEEDHSQPDLTKIKEDEAPIDDDDDDESMFDDEEFESPDSFPSSSSSSSSTDLKIAEVPANLTGNRWEAYQCEAVMLIALLGYLINFLIGRTKNSRLASIIYNSQRDLLVRNFSLVGDNGQSRTTETDEQINTMQKESENLYILWCSGRTSIESMLIELRFIKRQCLFNSVAALIKSINDTIVYTMDFSKEDMETVVFCLARKRCAAKLHRDMTDLGQFCSERKNAEKRGLSGNYQILNEIGEVSTAIIDSKVVDFIDKFPDVLEYIHISDQYTGMKAQNGEQQPSSSSSASNTGTATQQQDALNTSERSVRRVLIIAFNIIPQNGRSLQVTCESLSSEYLRLVLHLTERVSSFRLTSKESKMKAIKNRQRIEEQFFKTVNQQRQEQAQQRREDKRRAEKDKIMQSDDAELQRKWEEKEHKREMKRRQPKMKQMKLKAM